MANLSSMASRCSSLAKLREALASQQRFRMTLTIAMPLLLLFMFEKFITAQGGDQPRRDAVVQRDRIAGAVSITIATEAVHV